jgi:hypothetical protein
VQAVDRLGPSFHQVVTVVDDSPQRGDRGIDGCGVQSRRSQRSDPDRDRVGVIVLTAMTSGEQPDPRSELGGNVYGDHSVAGTRAVRIEPMPVAPSMALVVAFQVREKRCSIR